MEDVRRRLQGSSGGGMVDDNEKDGSDSNCSDNMSGSGAFRPTAAGSPKENSKNSNSYPTPNISVGPPIQPPPHLLPYLYPHGLYNHVAPPLSLLHNPAMNPGLFLNAQLALAAQHPGLFGHYSGHSPSSPLHNLKTHRFSPYSLPGLHQGSAFDAVTPGHSISNASGPPERSLSSSPPLSQHNLNSPSSNTRPQSASPTHSAESAFTPQIPSSNNNSSSGGSNNADRNGKNGNHSIDNGNIISNNNNNSSSNNNKNPTTASELKSMEKMVNGLDVHQNGTTVSTSLASSGSIRSLSPSDCESKKIINLEQ